MMSLIGASSSLGSGSTAARRVGVFITCLLDGYLLRNVAFLPIARQADQERPMDCTIRPALSDDAADISAVILRSRRSRKPMHPRPAARPLHREFTASGEEIEAPRRSRHQRGVLIRSIDAAL